MGGLRWTCVWVAVAVIAEHDHLTLGPVGVGARVGEGIGDAIIECIMFILLKK